MNTHHKPGDRIPDAIVAIRFKREFYEQIKRVAESEDIRAAQFIRHATRRALEKRSSKHKKLFESTKPTLSVG